jgi:hypothetical protein
MEQSNPTQRPAKSRLVSGTWRLLWSQQAEDASPLQKWGSSQSKNYQVRVRRYLTFEDTGLTATPDATTGILKAVDVRINCFQYIVGFKPPSAWDAAGR